MVVSRAFAKQIVALALLPLDVGVAAARASEHIHHRAVQDMLRRVGGLIFSLVVAVEYRLRFHYVYRPVFPVIEMTAPVDLSCVLESAFLHNTSGGRVVNEEVRPQS